MVRPTLQPPSFTCVVIIITIIIIVIVMVIIIVIIIIIIIIIITIITVIIVISVIIVIIVLIAIMITSLSTDLFIRYNFIRFGCMDSAQHSFRQHKVHSAQQPWYGLYGAGTVYIYILAFLSGSCVFVLSFSVASIANVSGQTSATAWKLFLADWLISHLSSSPDCSI